MADQGDDPRDRWERREGIDLWSIPHFLFGALAGTAPSFFGISSIAAIALTGVLAIGWEIGERAYGVEESARNIALDIIIAIAASGAVALALMRHPLPRIALDGIAGTVLGIYLILIFLGWRAYRRRGKKDQSSHPQE